MEDDYYLHLEFSDGLQTHLHTSWLWPELKRRIVIVGSTGMLIFDEVNQSVTLHRKRVNSELANVIEGEDVVFCEKGMPLKTALSHFISCVKSRETPLTSGESALPVVALLERVSG